MLTFQRYRQQDPFVLSALLSVLTFMLGIDILDGDFSRGILHRDVQVVWFLSLTILVFLISFLIFQAVTKNYREELLVSLIAVYIQVTVIFANIYFLTQAISIDTNAALPAIKMSDELRLINRADNPMLFGIILYVDSLYYSFITITTLGYGDITPENWYTKMLSVLHVTSGIYLIGISLNRHFSRQTREE